MESVLRARAVVWIEVIWFVRSEITSSQREDQTERMCRREDRDCGRRSRRGATEVICTAGGSEVGERRAVRREE